MAKCPVCGKTDFDDSDGCLNPKVYSPAVGDWMCAKEGGGCPLTTTKLEKELMKTANQAFSENTALSIHIEGLKEEVRILKKQREHLARRLDAAERIIQEMRGLLNV